MSNPNKLDLIAYSTDHFDGLEFPIVTAPLQREWMSMFNNNPYRCLPLTMANQLGWFILNPVGFTAMWRGDQSNSKIEITLDEIVTEKQRNFVSDHFGNGILTWSLPYVFRTSPGYNLVAHGPANWLKDGVQALEGMIESDWVDASFTMNWKITRSQHAIRFEKGEPICMLTPVRRGEIDQFVPSLKNLRDNAVLADAYLFWKAKRKKLATENGWRKVLAQTFQKRTRSHYDLHYLHGQTASGEKLIDDHQSRLNLKGFSASWQKQFQALKHIHQENKHQENKTNSDTQMETKSSES